MFNKKTYEGHWFDIDNNEEIDYHLWTEIVPPGVGYIFNDDKNEWFLEENNFTIE
jgi:hypothetical protein